jgi:hypothetical protein
MKFALSTLPGEGQYFEKIRRETICWPKENNLQNNFPVIFKNNSLCVYEG